MTQVRSARRYTELDSLRGLAALMVVIHHFWLTWPDWARTLTGPSFRGHSLDLLYPFHAGREAVIFFFILSGFVLSLPYLRGRSQSYPRYLAQRVLRIYGPYLVALLLCVGLAARFHGPTGIEWWARDFWTQPVSGRSVLQHVLFIGPYDTYRYDYVIWSLVYEMRISILFPVFVTVALFVRLRFSVLLAAGLTALALATALHFPADGDVFNLMMTFRYIPFFLGGILLAKNLPALAAWYSSRSRTGKIAFTIASFSLYNLSLSLLSDSPVPQFLGEWGVGLGAAGFLLLGLHATVPQRFLNSGVPRFLGRISYSLYLIHAPVLRLLTIAFGSRISPWLQFPIYLACAIVAGYCFCLAVEEPFMRLGRHFKASRAQALAVDHQLA